MKVRSGIGIFNRLTIYEKEKAEGIVPAKKVELWKYIAIILMSGALCVGLNNLLIISNLASLSEQYTETMEVL